MWLDLKYVCVEYQRKNRESVPDSISFQCRPLICFLNNCSKFSYATFCMSKIEIVNSFPMKKPF